MTQIQLPYPMAPGATLDFDFDWTSWLEVGDSFGSVPSVVSLDPNITIVPGSVTQVGGVVAWKMTLSATAPLYRTINACVATVSTLAGLSDPRVLTIVVQWR